MIDVADVVRRSGFFTICARNYLAHAAVLGRSITATQPDARLTVFLIDGPPPDAAGLEHIDIVLAETVMPQAEWHHRQCFYDLLELATSIKPACFIHMLDAGSDFVIYLDPDILVLKPLDEVFAAFASGHEIVLTPHLLTPLPPDGKLPDDLTIMNAGIYNLGFAAFANTTRCRGTLRWWDRSLRTLGASDLRSGTFTDQKWIDFIPVFEPKTFVLRHPGYNVAYWNLHERTVRQTGAGWRVLFGDGVEHDVVFFHFSGYRPAFRTLSRHENRFQDHPPGDTNRMLSHYASALAAAGLDSFATYPPPVPRLTAEAGWDPVCRTLYRAALGANVDLGDPLKDNAFIAYAAAKRGGDHLSRYLRTLLELRPDLAVAYDDGRDLPGLTRWLSRSGITESGIEPGLLALLGVATQDTSRANLASDGVTYVGYLRSHLGIGEAARNAIAALRTAGVDVATHDISDQVASPTGRYSIARPVAGAATSHAITILGVNADMTPAVLASRPEVRDATVLIGCWAWETPEFPEQWCDRFDLVDEVWVASRFVADAVRAKSTVPVTVVPYAVAPPKVEPDRTWLVATRPEIEAGEFIFLFLFDVASVPFRKNPEGAIAAFVKAFIPDEPVRLVIKSLNGNRDPALLERLTSMGRGHRVTVWDEPLETLDRFRLLATADALVSLHRAEGFGLSIAEAMAYGKPVVTTGWSGNNDFADAENAALVGYDLVRTDREHWPYPAGTLWAEPRLDDAARQMRRVWQDPAWRRAIGAKAAETIASLLSYEAVGAVMRTRLDRLSGAMRSSHVRRGDARALANAAIAAGPPPEPLPGAAVVRIMLRDVLRRPLFYVVRAPRLPRLMMTTGLRRSLQRAAHFASNRQFVPKQSFSLRAVVVRVARLLRLIRRRNEGKPPSKALGSIVRRNDQPQ